VREREREGEREREREREKERDLHKKVLTQFMEAKETYYRGKRDLL